MKNICFYSVKNIKNFHFKSVHEAIYNTSSEAKCLEESLKPTCFICVFIYIYFLIRCSNPLLDKIFSYVILFMFTSTGTYLYSYFEITPTSTVMCYCFVI